MSQLALAIEANVSPRHVTLLADVLTYPSVPVVPVSFSRHGRTYTFFSAVTTLGTPQDVTLQELRIECFFPMNAETERNVRALMSQRSVASTVLPLTRGDGAPGSERA